MGQQEGWRLEQHGFYASSAASSCTCPIGKPRFAAGPQRWSLQRTSDAGTSFGKLHHGPSDASYQRGSG